jgi:hypothetical protein
MFPANGGSVAAENARAEALGYERYTDNAQLQAGIDSGRLVPVPITVTPKLPEFRRFVTPEAADFMLTLDADFHRATGRYLIVDSAVRPEDVQRRLCRHNRNAAPASGKAPSSHERGTTFDLAKKFYNGRDYTRLTRAQYKWLLWRLMYYRETGRILVIEERACIHVFVGRLQDTQELRRQVLDGCNYTRIPQPREVVADYWSSQESPDERRSWLLLASDPGEATRTNFAFLF